MFLGMTILTFLARGSALNAMLMIILGFILSTVGIDPIEGIPRFSFGSNALLDGIGLVPVAMGIFGVAEVLSGLESTVPRSILQTKIKNIFPNLQDWKQSAGPIARGSVVGFFCGILPGAGAVMSTFLSYTMEKKLSKHPEEFGKGAIAGVAGPETANNAAAGGAFVPMLALGIPPNSVMAILLGALMIHGVSAGPLLITQHPDVFWGVIASMYVGNLMLVLLNLPLIGMWVKVLKVPPRILLPLILLCCLIGSYANANSSAEVIIMVSFGIVGYILKKLGYELAPLILALVLGPHLEANFSYSLTMSGGNLAIFFQRPISAIVLVIAGLLLLSLCLSIYRKTKTKIIEEMGDNDD